MSETDKNNSLPEGTPSEESEKESHQDSSAERTTSTENQTEINQNAAETEKEIETDLEKLQKQLEKAGSLADSYKDQLLRLAAEFENYKKRVEVDKADFVKFSNEKMIRDLIPVLHDFERALANNKQSSEGESFRKGVELIYQKFYKLLEDKGLKPIESVGREFDVMYHDVLMQVPRKDVKPDTIIEEVERGYTLHGKVVKHAKVIVASAGQDGTEQGEKN